jgi:hypothetical protein
MAKNWHQDITRGLVDTVNMIVDDYKTEKKIAAKKEQAAAKEKEAKDSDAEDEEEEEEAPAPVKADAENGKEKEDDEQKNELRSIDPRGSGPYLDKKKKPAAKKEEAKLKLSGKKEKVKINPSVKEENGMGTNPFQRAVQKSNQELNEVFQHTWGYGTPEEVEYREQWMARFNDYVIRENPHQYIDMLQVNAMYSAGSGPEEAGQRVLGYPATRSESNFQNRRRRFDHESGETSEYPPTGTSWTGKAN